MSLKSFLLNLFFPTACLNCGRAGARLCANCATKLKINLPVAGSDPRLVADHLDKIFIAGDYDNRLLKDLIKKFKYQFQTELGPILAGFLAEFWRQTEIAPAVDESPAPFLIVPVPLTRRRQNWRGFNQAAIIARDFSVRFGYKMKTDLKRIKHCPPQAELKESARLKNVIGAFKWTGENLSGRNIILIDDVVTTGATLNEAAKVLRRAGAGCVYGLVLAKG